MGQLQLVLESEWSPNLETRNTVPYYGKKQVWYQTTVLKWIYLHNIILIIIIPTEYTSVLDSDNNSYKIHICIEQNFTIIRHKATIKKHVSTHIMQIVNMFFDETDGCQSTAGGDLQTYRYIKFCSISPVIWYNKFHMVIINVYFQHIILI